MSSSIERNFTVEPISTALTGFALVQQGVDFVKKNINTAQDIGQIFGMVDAGSKWKRPDKQIEVGQQITSGSTQGRRQRSN